MYDLGFPTDSIEIVKNLHEEATIQVKHPSGHSTSPIPIERGTIQGVSVRPPGGLIQLKIFVFNIIKPI